MSIRAKPKHYGPLHVAGAGSDALAITTGAGAGLLSGATADSRTLPPGELLMAALGSCLAISLQMAAKSAGVDTGTVNLRVDADIDGGAPRRFDRFAVRVSMAAVSDPAVAAPLLARAKALCTVSHTLNAEITLVFEP